MVKIMILQLNSNDKSHNDRIIFSYYFNEH